MKWTHEKPTQPGWYWLRSDEVKPTIGAIGVAASGRLYFEGEIEVESVRLPLDRFLPEAEWAGPIPEPQ